ncbi:two-component system, OmpR family, phosphate regulon sensor histidine kinase PhoR [Alkalibacterium subtropicum]|uniref:histidine kinase n=1 Tax=Alkalibacterium subtropicum TaxID=753702 RepID=A0A1I1LUF2_9LACT|nr:ATP-binding protein [Alkalibacterium subtropicum]SFC73933.1 two-component system, OmpR family, phosphate regulon sensor histidine kinase PhoR [Alkalibacterium subtropicum]
MKQLRSRILGFFTLVLILFSLLFMYLSSNILENQAIEQQGNDLKAQLLTLSSQVDASFSDASWQDLSENLSQTAEAVSERITFISLTGEVVYDSRADQDTLENHLNRPEVQQVIEGERIGTYSRESASTGEYLYYVAVEVDSTEGAPLGYLRLSKNVEEMAALTDEVIQILLIFMAVSILVALLFTFYWTKRISDPLEEMKRVTENLTDNDYTGRYAGQSYKEIDDLGYSINRLALNLNLQMQEIRQNDAQLRELINHLVIGVFVINPDREITMVNPVMNDMLGKGLSGEIGETYHENIKSAGLIELIEKAYHKQRVQNSELVLYYPEEKIVDVNVVPIIDSEGNPVNYIVLLYDITEIRRLEKIRTDFVANVSHELRTPITAIRGFTETLLDGAMKDEEVLTEFLTIVNKESIRLSNMVEDILHLSKLEQRNVLKTLDEVRVKEVTDEIHKILHQKIESKNIQFTYEESDPVILKMDRDHLKQIILNLVANAVNYTPDNGAVSVKAETHDNEIAIHVKDNGIGIPPDKQDRIFERFYRVDKARSRNAGGTGLGLSIVKWLVENNDGRITLASEEEKGSLFTVWLPAEQ